MWKLIILSCSTTILAAKSKNFINFGDFICPREERALERCLKDSLNNYIPHLAIGVPAYGIPSCEPLLVPELELAQTAGPVAVTSSYYDVTVRGPSTMRVKEIDVDSKSHQVVAKLYIPELRMKGRYKISGQLLMLPITGQGLFTGKYNSINAVVTIALGRAPRKGGPDALTCEELDVKFQIGKATMHLENLFGGDDELGNTVNKFLNENWLKLSEELQVPLQGAMRGFLKPLANHAFGTLNADDILS